MWPAARERSTRGLLLLSRPNLERSTAIAPHLRRLLDTSATKVLYSLLLDSRWKGEAMPGGTKIGSVEKIAKFGKVSGTITWSEPKITQRIDKAVTVAAPGAVGGVGAVIRATAEVGHWDNSTPLAMWVPDSRLKDVQPTFSKVRSNQDGTEHSVSYSLSRLPVGKIGLTFTTSRLGGTWQPAPHIVDIDVTKSSVENVNFAFVPNPK
jgi:hypothetical protein